MRYQVLQNSLQIEASLQSKMVCDECWNGSRNGSGSARIDALSNLYRLPCTNHTTNIQEKLYLDTKETPILYISLHAFSLHKYIRSSTSPKLKSLSNPSPLPLTVFTPTFRVPPDSRLFQVVEDDLKHSRRDVLSLSHELQLCQEALNDAH